MNTVRHVDERARVVDRGDSSHRSVPGIGVRLLLRSLLSLFLFLTEKVTSPRIQFTLAIQRYGIMILCSTGASKDIVAESVRQFEQAEFLLGTSIVLLACDRLANHVLFYAR